MYSGLDLSRLTGAMRPAVVVTATDIARVNIRLPDFFKDADLFCPVGKTPHYLGQPVALADLRHVRRLRPGAHRIARSRRRSSSAARPARWSPSPTDRTASRASPGPIPTARTSFRRCRRAGPRRSATKRRKSRCGRRAHESRQRQRPGLVLRRAHSRRARGSQSRRARARSHVHDAIDRSRCSSSPRAASPGTTRKPRCSSSSSACNRPREAAESVAHLLGAAKGSLKPAAINTHFAYVGGGFGGRDHTPMPLYIALAAMFYPGRAVRLAHDRFQQFQAGIKRHRVQDALASSASIAHRQDPRVGGRPRARRRRHGQFLDQRRRRGSGRDVRHLRRAQGRRDHDRGPFARRDGRIDARLRHAADDDRARSADRRGRRPRSRSTRSSCAGATR